LHLVKAYGAAVMALPFDEQGIPNDSEMRMKIAGKIVDRCGEYGIPVQDIVADFLALSAGGSWLRFNDGPRHLREMSH